MWTGKRIGQWYCLESPELDPYNYRVNLQQRTEGIGMACSNK